MLRCGLRGMCLAIGLLAVLLNTNQVAGEDEENPIITSVKSRLKNPDKPFTLIVRVQVKEEADKQFEAAFAKAIPASRKEKGNLAYDLNHDTSTVTLP